MRVMFVDDEQKVLEGIERSLFALDIDWDVVCAGSGSAALAALERAPFDAIVSDMRMPGMNGRELLGEVQRRWPDTLRIILSGFSEKETALRSLDVAHRFLAKPCDGAVIAGAVESLRALRELLSSASLKRLVGSVGHLPPTPRIYAELVQRLADADIGIKAVAGILNQDPALSAKILQIANSAFFCRGRAVADVAAAVAHVGLDTTRSLVLLTEVSAHADARAAADLQRRALRALRIAEYVGGEACGANAATAALLCDIALLIPDLEAHCRAAAARGEGSFGHAEVGAYLLGTWGLPMDVVEAVAHHEHPANVSDTFDAAGIAHVASALARGAEPDAEYLASRGLQQRGDEWKRFAEQLALSD